MAPIKYTAIIIIILVQKSDNVLFPTNLNCKVSQIPIIYKSAWLNSTLFFFLKLCYVC